VSHAAKRLFQVGGYSVDSTQVVNTVCYRIASNTGRRGSDESDVDDNSSEYSCRSDRRSTFFPPFFSLLTVQNTILYLTGCDISA
jgi:hypothetical protein